MIDWRAMERWPHDDIRIVRCSNGEVAVGAFLIRNGRYYVRFPASDFPTGSVGRDDLVRLGIIGPNVAATVVEGW